MFCVDPDNSTLHCMPYLLIDSCDVIDAGDWGAIKIKLLHWNGQWWDRRRDREDQRSKGHWRIDSRIEFTYDIN